MNSQIVILSIIFTSVIGLVTLIGLNLISVKNKLFVISISFGLGVGLITTQLFFYSRVGIPWRRENILIPWIFIILVFVIKKIKNFRFIRFPSLKVADFILLFLILLSFFYTFFEALIRPVAVWDAWATWLLESKIFFLDGNINPSIFNYLHSEYPLVFKLYGTFIYIILGKVDDTSVLLISFAFYIFLSLSFFSLTEEKFGTRYGLVFTFLFVTTQNFIRHGGRIEAGLADLPLGYFGLVSYALLINYFQKSTAKNVLLLNIFLGVTVLIKFEGIPLSIIIGICAIYHIYKRKFYRHLPIFFLWVLPYLDWQIYRKLSGVVSAYSERHHLEISSLKTLNAVRGTLKELVSVKSWNLLWLTFFYSLFISPAKKHKELLFLYFIILSQLSIYLLIYIFSSNYNPESSIERLLLHIAPMAFYAVVITAYELTYKSLSVMSRRLFRSFNKMISKL